MRAKVGEEKKDPFELNRRIRDAYQNMPKKDYLRLRDELCVECYWSETTFYHRVNLQRAVLPIEISHIKKVFEKFGIDIFKDLKL